MEEAETRTRAAARLARQHHASPAGRRGPTAVSERLQKFLARAGARLAAPCRGADHRRAGWR